MIFSKLSRDAIIGIVAGVVACCALLFCMDKKRRARRGEVGDHRNVTSPSQEHLRSVQRQNFVDVS
jgi:hypothetical protein